MRLVITVLLLVVLPTALLSVLAGRSLQARELILERRLEQEAIAHLESVAIQVDETLREVLTRVALIFSNTAPASFDVGNLAEAEAVLQRQSSLIARVLLFMNPWAFVYPDPETLESNAEGSALLQQQLTRALAMSGMSRDGVFTLVAAERLYCFEAVPAPAGLYAGFELNAAAAFQDITGMLERNSTPYIRLAVLSVDAPERWMVDAPDAVRISDTLGDRTERGAAGGFAGVGRQRQTGLLASGRLAPPFAHMEIGAFTVDASLIRTAFTLQQRLERWGILLLAVVITGSTVTLLAGARRQAVTARRRSEFMAGMSHDLRTPVAAMRMLAESLRVGRVETEARQHQFLATIVTECDRLGRLIDRIMFYFRQERSGLRLSRRPLRINAFMAALTERAASRFGGCSRIVFEGEASDPAVEADADALEKALANLLDNAVKYGRGGTGEDTMEIRVQVRIAPGRWWRWVVLAVSDRGPGVPLEERRLIFRRFQRGTVGRQLTGGIGLGLSMVADIVKAHGGRVRVGDADGGGAVFEIWLPEAGPEGSNRWRFAKWRGDGLKAEVS